jgi:hypothetical protein
MPALAVSQPASAPSQSEGPNYPIEFPNLEPILMELKTFQDQVSTEAAKYFEVRGDLVIFKNTDALAKAIHSGIVRLNSGAQATVRALNGYADTVRRADQRAAFLLIVRILVIRKSDPAIMELAALLAEAAVCTTDAPKFIELLLRKLAKNIEDGTKGLATGSGGLAKLRVGAWVAMKGNAFNWKLQKFELAPVEPVPAGVRAATNAAMNNVAISMNPAARAAATIGEKLGEKFASLRLGTRVFNWTANSAIKQAKKDAPFLFLSFLLGKSLAKAGLPAAAIDPTVNMLVSVAREM